MSGVRAGGATCGSSQANTRPYLSRYATMRMARSLGESPSRCTRYMPPLFGFGRITRPPTTPNAPEKTVPSASAGMASRKTLQRTPNSFSCGSSRHKPSFPATFCTLNHPFKCWRIAYQSMRKAADLLVDGFPPSMDALQRKGLANRTLNATSPSV